MTARVWEAGPELDAAVARVLGWTTYEEFVHGPMMHGGALMRLYRGRGIPYNGITPSVESWKPSSEMTAAMVVLDDMARPGFRVHIAANGCGDFDVTWDVAGGNEKLRWDCLAEETEVPTLPLALCRALLSMQAPEYVPLAALEGGTP